MSDSCLMSIVNAKDKIQNFASLIWIHARALYHTLFWNTSVFFMRMISKFFRLNAYDNNVIKGDKLKVLVYFIKINNYITSDEQSIYVIFNFYVYCLPTYTVAVSQLTRTLRKEGFHQTNIISLIFHFISIIITGYQKLCCFCIG